MVKNNNNNSDHSHPEKHKLIVFVVKWNWLLPFGSWPVHLFQYSWFPHSGYFRASPVVSGKESACSAGDTRDGALIPGLGRSSRVGNGNPPQYSCLGNPMDRGAWQAIVHGVAKRQMQLSTQTCTCRHFKMFVGWINDVEVSYINHKNPPTKVCDSWPSLGGIDQDGGVGGHGVHLPTTNTSKIHLPKNKPYWKLTQKWQKDSSTTPAVRKSHRWLAGRKDKRSGQHMCLWEGIQRKREYSLGSTWGVSCERHRLGAQSRSARGEWQASSAIWGSPGTSRRAVGSLDSAHEGHVCRLAPWPGREALLEVCCRGCQVSGGAGGLAAAHITEPRWRRGSRNWGEHAAMDTESLGGDVAATVGTNWSSPSEAAQNCGRDRSATSHTWGMHASPASPVAWLPAREGWWGWGSDEGKRRLPCDAYSEKNEKKTARAAQTAHWGQPRTLPAANTVAVYKPS